MMNREMVKEFREQIVQGNSNIWMYWGLSLYDVVRIFKGDSEEIWCILLKAGQYVKKNRELTEEKSNKEKE